MKLIFTLILFVGTLAHIYSQGGIQIHGGIINGITANPTLTPIGTNHTGYRLGADVRFFDSKMYFLGGLHLVQHSWIGTEDAQYFSPQQGIVLWKPRFGLGFHILKVGRVFRLRAKALATANIVRSFPKNDLPMDLTFYNDLYTGIDFGVGVDLLLFTLDLEYQIGIDNAVNEIKDTKYNYASLTLGIFF